MENEFEYSLLGRMQVDCDYFLGLGNRCVKHLWSVSVEKQIEKMKELWNNFEEKPEWLSMEDILNYEEIMTISATSAKEKIDFLIWQESSYKEDANKKPIEKDHYLGLAARSASRRIPFEKALKILTNL